MDRPASSSPFAAMDASGDTPRRSDPVMPLAALPLALSVVGIGFAALAFCCIAAMIAVLILIADLGTGGFADFYDELRFDGPLETQISVLVVSALYGGVALATVTAAVWRGRRGWRPLVALSRVRHWRDIAIMSAFTIAYAAVATSWLEHANDRRLLVSGQTDLLLVGTIVMNLVVLAPLAEELFFRGWLYTGLRGRFGFWPSFLATVMLFAAIHWDPNHRRVFQVLPLALALGWLRERAGSIKPTILVHAAYNLTIVAIRLAYT